MYSKSSILVVLLSVLAAVQAADSPRPCGAKIAPCPSGSVCVPNDPTCTRGDNCIGLCRPSPVPPPTTTTGKPPRPTYQSCGGFRVEPVKCPDGQICVDDPRSGGCGMACDAPGICVTPKFCGGFAAIKCPEGLKCIDDPRDSCDPKHGGADCGGICV